MSTSKNAKDFWSGVMFAALGVFFIIFAQEHELGTAARMGPAYFPTLLGGLLTALGLLIAVKGLMQKVNAEEGRVGRFHWRILGLILGSVLLFSLLLETCGLMIALAAMIAVAALADRSSRPKEVIAMIIVLDFIAWFVFVYLIGMLVPVWPAFLG